MRPNTIRRRVVQSLAETQNLSGCSDWVNMQRIRVLHIVQNLNYGGMERLIAGLVQHADRLRFDNHILALEYLGRFSKGLEGVARLHTAERMSLGSMIRPSSLIRRIRKIMPAVVHTHSGVWFKASLAARQAGVPYLVHTDHGRKRPDPWSDRLLDGLAARRTDIIIAVSADLGEVLASNVIGDLGRLRIIPNGVDSSFHRPRIASDTLRTELGIPPKAPIIGSIGRLESIKGYDIMLAAMAELLTHWRYGPLPVLLIAGDGSERPRLEDTIQKRSLENHVHLLGWRDDVRDLHDSFSLFTMSSRSEGTSVSLLEAMSAELCPIVTDVGGNAAVLGMDLRHRLVPPDNPGALAAAWRAALQDRMRLEVDAGTARRRVESEFTIAATVRAYESIYFDLCKRG